MADSTVPPRPRISAPLRGVLWMVASCACFALMATMVRRASFDVHPVEIVFFRYLFGLLFLAPWLLRAGLAPLRTRAWACISFAPWPAWGWSSPGSPPFR